ncbi:UNVERIFIED_CONTAM: hypothetical protein BEN50_20560 [Euhalothece sp. KZN 001]
MLPIQRTNTGEYRCNALGLDCYPSKQELVEAMKKVRSTLRVRYSASVCPLSPSFYGGKWGNSHVDDRSSVECFWTTVNLNEFEKVLQVDEPHPQDTARVTTNRLFLNKVGLYVAYNEIVSVSGDTIHRFEIMHPSIAEKCFNDPYWLIPTDLYSDEVQ